MLEGIIGSRSRERVLVYISTRKEGYAREIARFFGTGLTQIQKQLENLESSGILVSRKVGRTRLYEFNPRYALLEELQTLLKKAVSFYPEKEREKLLMVRRRPRRKGKPL